MSSIATLQICFPHTPFVRVPIIRGGRFKTWQTFTKFIDCTVIANSKRPTVSINLTLRSWLRPKQIPLMKGFKPCHLLNLPWHIQHQSTYNGRIIERVIEIALILINEITVIKYVVYAHLRNPAEILPIPCATSPVPCGPLQDKNLASSIRVVLQGENSWTGISSALPWRQWPCFSSPFVISNSHPWQESVRWIVKALP